MKYSDNVPDSVYVDLGDLLDNVEESAKRNHYWYSVDRESVLYLVELIRCVIEKEGEQ